MASGWIKLHRCSLDNPVVMKDAEHLAVWIYLLLNASHADFDIMYSGKKKTLTAGQLRVSRQTIAREMHISESKVQRILKTFEIEQQIEQQTNFHDRVISILNWDKYQQIEQQTEQQVNSKRTASEQQVNANKNIKNNKNFKEKEINKEKERFGEFENVLLTADEYRKLSEKFPNDFRDRIERLSCYMASQKKSYASHYATILSWARKDEKDNPPPPKKYKEFQKEVYERDDFKSEQMPEEIKSKLSGMFTKGEKS